MLFVTNAWNVVPFPCIILLAGLQAIPQRLHKARTMDGSGPWRRLWDVRLPLLTPQIFVLTPLVFVAITATQSYADVLRNDFSLIPARHFLGNLSEVWTRTDLPRQTLNSIVVVVFTGRGRGPSTRWSWPRSCCRCGSCGTSGCRSRRGRSPRLAPACSSAPGSTTCGRSSPPPRPPAPWPWWVLPGCRRTASASPIFPLPMTDAILVTLPPLILIALFQRRIVRGLTLTEK
ncbi:ABC transporter permease subunit [Salipiger thiooxidans]|uniref:ABC transporter permease subunit n=1 Tax=Salipiger thiooxidans TaxID=282683 RepID=UPI001A907BE7|nr:ABC transporter permease subunit [Salipiger thiooxidans]MBN8188345.1 ABC transporter permease subunit [Salipiger thiooxidans]